VVAAAVMLFYVSYWLLTKVEVAKWNSFVKTKVQDAVSSGSAVALASVAFLAVYREGFETVLFYKALMLSGGVGSLFPILAGMAVGTLVLVVVYVAITRFGVRLPLRPFFTVTSAFLYYMAFVFAGKAVAELQEGGLVGTTSVPWAPRLPALGIYPTAESLLARRCWCASDRGHHLDLLHRARPGAAPAAGARAGSATRAGAVIGRIDADLARRGVGPRPDRLVAPRGVEESKRVEMSRGFACRRRSTLRPPSTHFDALRPVLVRYGRRGAAGAARSNQNTPAHDRGLVTWASSPPKKRSPSLAGTRPRMSARTPGRDRRARQFPSRASAASATAACRRRS
jgi:hypothetical protein